MPEDLSHRTSRKLSPGWHTPRRPVPLPDPADRYLVHPRTTVVLLGK